MFYKDGILYVDDITGSSEITYFALTTFLFKSGARYIEIFDTSTNETSWFDKIQGELFKREASGAKRVFYSISSLIIKRKVELVNEFNELAKTTSTNKKLFSY